MMPLLPPGAIFHSSLRSKFSYSFSETISPPSAVCQSFLLDASRRRVPSSAFQALPMVCFPYVCQPRVEVPSNSSSHPLLRSPGLNTFSVMPACFEVEHPQIKIIASPKPPAIILLCISLMIDQVKLTHSLNSFSEYATPYCFNTSSGTPFHWFG